MKRFTVLLVMVFALFGVVYSSDYQKVFENLVWMIHSDSDSTTLEYLEPFENDYGELVYQAGLVYNTGIEDTKDNITRLLRGYENRYVDFSIIGGWTTGTFNLGEYGEFTGERRLFGIDLSEEGRLVSMVFLIENPEGNRTMAIVRGFVDR